MVKFCTSCGTANTPDAHYCAKCGTAMVPRVAEPVRERVESPLQPDEHADISPLAPVEAFPSAETPPERNWLVVTAAVVGSLLLIGGVYYWLFLADDMSGSSLSTASTSESVPAVAPVQLFTITDANIRDKPTTSGSIILGKLPRGSAISGVLKVSEDGSEWLELSEGKGFVATVNLVELQPPELVRTLGDRSWTADGRIDVFAADGQLLDSVGQGTVVKLSGLTAEGVLEIKLPDGRIGYVPGGKEILARLGGKPIAIAFNPATCNFGSELGAEFGKIGARLKAQWQALEDKDFADDEARDKAFAAAEGKSSYVKLARSFEGLSLTAIGQHYESQSLYFAEPPAKVIEVFRANGFRIDGNGNFPSTELYAGISSTRGEGAAYGKSELGCGV